MTTTTTQQALRRGARIETTGQGITEHWTRRLVGAVVRVRGDKVHVRWDGFSFDDEMAQAEVRPEWPAYLNGCPCANCIHS